MAIVAAHAPSVGGSAAALTQKQRDDIKRAFKLKKALYERLLKSEPGVLDYLMTAEDGKAVRLAARREAREREEARERAESAQRARARPKPQSLPRGHGGKRGTVYV